MTTIHLHLAAADVLGHHGIAPPKAWEALRAGHNELLQLDNEHRATEQLAAALIAGVDKADLPAMYSNALAEWNSPAVPDVRNLVGARVHAALQTLYAPTAKRAYPQVRDEFDAAAKAFTALADTVDVESADSVIVRADNRSRQAWMDAPALARRLDELASVLAAAATLVGADPGLMSLTPETEGLRLALVCQPGDTHRRRVYEAYNATGQCGRWSALHTLGVEIRAHRDPANLQPYREPGQKGVQFILGANGGHTVVAYDPEDPVNTLAAEWSA